MSKNRKQKLQLLKQLVAKQNEAKKLAQEQQLNLLETKLLEQQLLQMRADLEQLEHRRNELLRSKGLEGADDIEVQRQILQAKRAKMQLPDPDNAAEGSSESALEKRDAILKKQQEREAATQVPTEKLDDIRQSLQRKPAVKESSKLIEETRELLKQKREEQQKGEKESD